MRKFGFFLLSTIYLVFLNACSAQESNLNSTHVLNPSARTDLKLEVNFRECLINKSLNRQRTSFEQIKKQCFAEGITTCNGSKSCEFQFKSEVHGLMERATAVDCDSGYCTVMVN
jgi:UDP-3-O-acyl-N-acetylglucosamine deacetylase